MKPVRINMPKFNALVFLACACLMITCTDKADPSDHSTPTVHAEDLWGTWTRSHGTIKEIPDYVENDFAYSEWSPTTSNWEPIQLRFIGDSMEVFAYPFEYHGTYAFEVSDNELRMQNNSSETEGRRWDVETIRVDQDSLWRTVAQEGYWITSHFFRDTLDADMLALLRRDSVDATALHGIWRLDTTVSVDYDEDFTIDLPFEIPDSLVFSPHDIGNINGRIISIKVNSSPRPFRFGFVSKHRIWLKPAGWYSEWLHPIEYNKEYFISLLEYKGINKVEEIKRMEIAYAADIATLLGQEDTGRTVRTTEKPAEILAFMDLLFQLSHKGTGKEYRYRPDSVPSWRIRLVDQKDLWHNVLFIGNQIETSTGSPGEYYADQKNMALEAELYALMQAFMLDEE